MHALLYTIIQSHRDSSHDMFRANIPDRSPSHGLPFKLTILCRGCLAIRRPLKRIDCWCPEGDLNPHDR
jgi:hypothetical protein